MGSWILPAGWLKTDAIEGQLRKLYIDECLKKHNSPTQHMVNNWVVRYLRMWDCFIDKSGLSMRGLSTPRSNKEIGVVCAFDGICQCGECEKPA